ncbi:MAG: hypothetical protein AB8V23_02095 [Candidatus Midichloria sp.]|uniref:Uncharacterized protein n=1 Tax=Hyalomma marginatum TaxID=34627 RepID=A0A8S4C1M5_9ACAR|nr:hypothetical protein MHYMCMPSP_00184 [Hyalomma marginatum]CAG7592038.1 hypothetical protein MHYMCMPASI_00516 [Hyalomma marginatum]
MAFLSPMVVLNLTVLRPADAIETIERFEIALKNDQGPILISP